MRTEFWMDSQGQGKLHCCRWSPEGEIIGVVQIVHGIADYGLRYEPFAEYLNGLGYLVVAEDHMGHGQSIQGGSLQGYFHGGWFTAVEDTYQLLKQTKEAYPDVPYVLFGHSMGSFMARTLLSKHPDSGIAAAVICGTSWQPTAALPAIVQLCKAVCALTGEKNPSEQLQNLVFGGYNRRVEHPRTSYDWISRDNAVVDAYVADPLCGFTPTTGLTRDMMIGISFIQQPANLKAMNKALPVLFIGGGDDPVGYYGKSIVKTAEEFRKAGMQDISHRVFPLGRHEILNEINRKEVFKTVSDWIQEKTK